MLFFRCVGCAYVDHGPAGPRLLRQVEETAGVVIDDVKPPLAGADVEVAVNPDAKGRAADLLPRGARHEVDNAVIAPGSPEEQTSELPSIMHNSYAVFRLKHNN